MEQILAEKLTFMIYYMCNILLLVFNKEEITMKPAINAKDAAFFLFSLDPDRKYFNQNLIKLNGAEFYEGNARLNKIMHLAQNIYIGRTGEKLIDADFFAYANGGVIPDIQENFAYLSKIQPREVFAVAEEEAIFLQKVFTMLKDAPIERLIEIDHEDPSWYEKKDGFYRSEQRMDSLKYKDDYKERYEAANFYIDNMEASC